MKKVLVFVFIFALIASSVFASAYTVQTIEPSKGEDSPFIKIVKGKSEELTQTVQNTVQKTDEKIQEAAGKTEDLIHSGASQSKEQSTGQSSAPSAAGIQSSDTKNSVQAGKTSENAPVSGSLQGSKVENTGLQGTESLANAPANAQDAGTNAGNIAGSGQLRVNSKGNFRLGISAGYSVHNGKYDSTTGTDNKAYETELKTSFLTLSLLMSYKLKVPAEIYGNISFGFPESMTIDGKIHNNNNYWIKDDSKFRNNRGYTSFSLGGAYAFNASDFTILAGAGFNYNRLYRVEERRTTNTDNKTQLEKMGYEFSQFGVNLHLEARYEFNDYCELVGVISPTIGFSARYMEEYTLDGKRVNYIQRTANKINLDFCGTIGAVFKF